MTQTATIANGCFWCTQAIFQQLKGVDSVKPGYTGGHNNNPSYEQVGTGNSGHAEAIQIIFNPEVISYETLLDVFFHTHNPTTLNKQGADAGTQYRSEIFYHDDEQKEIAKQSLTDFKKEGIYPDPIVTQISKFNKFFIAEDYHNDYYKNNPEAGYCKAVIEPKLEKFWKKYKNLTK
jgi:peptide-methionine (S)-S-oxide reductase